MFGKFKRFIGSRRQKKNRPNLTDANGLGSWTPYVPHDQPSPRGPDYTTTGPSIVVSPPDQRLTTAEPMAEASLRSLRPSGHIAGDSASMNMRSIHLVDMRDHSNSGHRPTSRSPSPGLQQNTLQDNSVVTDTHSIKHATFQQGTFSNAQNVQIGTAYMNDYSQGGDEGRKKQEEKALEKLAAKVMPSAMLDSNDRGYVPRCNEDTRQALRERIVTWGQNHEDIQRLLWLSGPAGVGKSAVAQTAAEEMQKEGLLGAVFFFSRPNDRSNPDVVVPTLVYQLALLLPEYRRIVTQRLITDPFVLTRSRRSQFKELIVDPFLALTSHPPLLIVLDGLDECDNLDAQCEFVEMISYHVRREISLRLRWMICSRPEPDLRVSFSSEDCKVICLEVKLEVDDSEAQKDAWRILKTGFADIRRRYPDHVTGHWPAEDQIRFIANKASGHLGFVSFIIRFIGDKHYANPSGQLNVCLEFLERTGGSMDINPLLALDLLYTQILSDIPVNILPTTRRILALFIFYDATHLTVAAHANFLCLGQAAYYSSLQRLHSVLSIPPASEASYKPIQMYHTSFSDYLKDPSRSGKFVLEEGVVPYLEIAISGLKWLGYGYRDPSSCVVQTFTWWREYRLTYPIEQIRPELTWIPDQTSRESVLSSLCEFSFTPCWRACLKVPEDSLAALLELLNKFDFNLDYHNRWNDETKDFAYFIRWLATSHKPLVTTAASGSEKIEIWHRDDFDAFFHPFPANMRPWDSLSTYIRIGINNPVSLCLKVTPTCNPLLYRTESEETLI